MPYCHSCATKLSSSSERCSNCGQLNDKSNNNPKIAFGIVFSILSFAALLFLFSKPTPSRTEINSENSDSSYAVMKQNSVKQNPEPPLPVIVGEDYANSSYNALCANRYPSDFSMRAACRRNAKSGRSDFIDIWNRYISNDSMNLALQNCFQRYTEDGSTDFAMLGACARNQERGFKEIN